MKPLSSKSLNILLSYAYIGGGKPNAYKTDQLLHSLLYLSELGLVNILIDSGAFTMFHSNRKINVNDYIRFCKAIDGKVWQYIMLDSIGNAVESKKNLNAMVKAGLVPMPVLTIDDDVESAKELYKVNEYICVAGGTAVPDAQMIQRYRDVVKLIPGIKIHGLAFVKLPAFYKLPLFSADSSSFVSGQKFGSCAVFNNKTHLVEILGSASDMRKPKVSDIPQRMKRWWTDIGLHPKDRQNPEYHKGDTPFYFQTMKAYVDMQRYAKRVDRQQFLAISTHNQLEGIILTAHSSKVNGGKLNFPELLPQAKLLAKLRKTDIISYNKFLAKLLKEATQ